MSLEIQLSVFDPESEEEGEIAQEPLPDRLSMDVSEW